MYFFYHVFKFIGGLALVLSVFSFVVLVILLIQSCIAKPPSDEQNQRLFPQNSGRSNEFAPDHGLM